MVLWFQEVSYASLKMYDYTQAKTGMKIWKHEFISYKLKEAIICFYQRLVRIPATYMGIHITAWQDFSPHIWDYISQLGNFSPHIWDYISQLGNFLPHIWDYISQLGNLPPHVWDYVSQLGKFPPHIWHYKHIKILLNHMFQFWNITILLLLCCDFVPNFWLLGLKHYAMKTYLGNGVTAPLILWLRH
jgi:hypothetical protein